MHDRPVRLKTSECHLCRLRSNQSRWELRRTLSGGQLMTQQQEWSRSKENLSVSETTLAKDPAADAVDS